MINIESFDSNLLKTDKKHYKWINIFYIGYITIKKIDDCENIHSVNPLYLLVNHASGYIEEKNGNKYLIFDDSVNENKALLKKYADVWDGIKNEIKAINGGKENDYGKDYMKIKFNSDDDLPLNKPLKFHAMTIIIRSVFEEDGKFYEPYLCNGCHDLMQKAMIFNDVAIIYVRGSAYRIYFWYMSKDDASSIMNNSILVDKNGVF